MTRPSDIPEWALEAAMAVQDAAEAECKAEKYVYGFGTGNAKTVLDNHIARALIAAQAEAIEAAAPEMLAALRLALPWVSAPLDDKDMSSSAVAHRAIARVLAKADSAASLPSAQRRGE